MLRKLHFLIFKLKWKIKNKNNFTWPGNVCNLDRVEIGKYTYGQINAYTSECEDSYLKIGSFCSVSSSAKFILGAEHNFKRIMTYPIKQKILKRAIDTKSKGKVIIEDDVWIGENALIMSGVHVGQGAIIAAGATVVNDVEPYAIVGGVPARCIKKRFSQDIINELLKIDYSLIDEKFIIENAAYFENEIRSMSQLDFLEKYKKAIGEVND